MNVPVYELTISKDKLRYTFVSIGLKGQINKVIEYTYLPDLGLWNLGFGDLETTSGQVSDNSISDNGDGRKVLATVVRSLFSFFDENSMETVLFTGSDERRTRIYHRAVIQYQSDFSTILRITGLTEEGLEKSIETDKTYLAFIIRKVHY